MQISHLRVRTSPRARFILLALAVSMVLTINLAYLGTSKGLRDFAAFAAAGQSAASGFMPYRDDYAATVAASAGAVVVRDDRMMPPNLNPPFSVLLFRLFAGAEPHAALFAWRALSFVLYLAALYILAGRQPAAPLTGKLGWALLLAGFWQTLELGQIYVLLAAAACAAWRLLDRGQAAPAGLLMGFVLALKPNFVVWPVCLFLAGYRRPALVAAFTAGLLYLAPALVYGPTIFVEWLRLAGGFNNFALAGNASLAGVGARLGSPQLGGLLGAILLAALASWLLRKRPPVRQTSALALVASLLASPIAWAGYTIVLVPAYVDRRWSPLVWCSAALLLVPFPVVWVLSELGPAALAVFGSMYAAALVLAFAAFARTAAS